MNSKKEYEKILRKYVDNSKGLNIEELEEAFMLDIGNFSIEINEELLPIIKYLIKKLINDIDSYDFIFTTVHPELFKYALSFIDQVDVIGAMREYEDGPENLIDIIDMLVKHKLKLPKNIIEKHFSYEDLKWCGYNKDDANELYKKITN